MTVRRGRIANDESAVERRQWFANEQEKVFEKNTTFAASITFQSPQSKIVNFTDEDSKLSSELNDSEIKQEVQVNNWLVKLNNVKVVENTPTIVCFHGVGGNHSYFQKWGKELFLKSILLYGVCLPGRMNHPECSKQLQNWNHYIESIYIALIKCGAAVKKLKDRPSPRKLVFVGHCVGAVLSFEVARLLQANGFEVSCLVVCSSPSPDSLSSTNRKRIRQVGRIRKDEFTTMTLDERPQGLEMFSSYEDEDLLDRLIQLDGVRPLSLLERRHDLLKLFLPLLRSDYAFLEAYQAMNPLEVDVASLLDSQGPEKDEGVPVELRRIRKPFLPKVAAQLQL